MNSRGLVAYLLLLDLASLDCAHAGGIVSVALPSQVRDTRGSVILVRSGSTVPMPPSTPLYAGDELRVAADSTAILWLQSGTTLKLNEGTTVQLIENSSKRTHLRLQEGSLFAKGPNEASRCDIDAGSLTFNLRGAEFFIGWNRPGTESKRDLWVFVQSGSAKEASKKLEVTAGLGVKISDGARPGPLSRFRWTEHLNWTTDASQGEIQNPRLHWDEARSP